MREPQRRGREKTLLKVRAVPRGGRAGGAAAGAGSREGNEQASCKQ